MGDDKGMGIVAFIAIAIGFTIGMVCGVNIERWSWHKEAIERDVAKYNDKTGDWQWIPKPIEVTDVGIVKDGVVHWNSGSKQKLP